MPPDVQNLFIPYFPYLNMQNVPEIDFGFGKIWNFDNKKLEYVPDPAVRTHIEKVFSTHKTQFREVTDIGIFSTETVDFHEPTPEEYKLIRYARLILFICFAARNNTIKPGPNAGHFMATSENFDLLMQRTQVGTDHLAESTGAIVQFLIGGLDMNRVIFQRPSFVPQPAPFGIDTDLFRGLLDLRTTHPKVFEKVINAIEIFFESYYNSPYVSRSARILLQASAFEILLDLPERNQRMVFKQKIRRLSFISGEPLVSHFSERTGGRKARERISLKEIWADKFYTLRNHIVHGQTPAPAEFIFKKSQMHFDIALLFFVLCLKKKVSQNIPTAPCNHEIRWETWEDDMVDPPQHRSGFVYNISFRNFLKRQLWQARRAPSS